MKTTNQKVQASTQRTPRAEAASVFESELVTLSMCSERAALMADDLVDNFFGAFAEGTNRQSRENAILFYFEQNRIRAEILQSILFEMREVAKGLYAEVRGTGKRQAT